MGPWRKVVLAGKILVRTYLFSRLDDLLIKGNENKKIRI